MCILILFLTFMSHIYEDMWKQQVEASSFDVLFFSAAEKVLKELIEPYSLRVQRLQEFLRDVKPSLQVEIVPLDDPYGVSVVDPLLQCIVVSEETKRGGEAVNKKRTENVSKEVNLKIGNTCNTGFWCIYPKWLAVAALVLITNARVSIFYYKSILKSPCLMSQMAF